MSVQLSEEISAAIRLSTIVASEISAIGINAPRYEKPKIFQLVLLGTTGPALRTLSRPARVLRTTDPPPNLVLDYLGTCKPVTAVCPGHACHILILLAHPEGGMAPKGAEYWRYLNSSIYPPSYITLILSPMGFCHYSHSIPANPPGKISLSPA
jgi:hypothetical protein